MEIFVGRKEEVSILQTALKSEKAEMIAVIGRRRIGKTFLIRRTLGKYIDFELTGIKDASLSEQLQNFSYKLTECFNSPVQLKAPKNWLEAFHQLTQYLKSKNLRRKLVIFLDELPWIATRGSRFLAALGHFWNDWAERNNVMLIICGSAASWMNTKVVHHKGSLHNRITRRIALQTFNLAEVELLLRSRNIKVDRYDILLYYMTLGGVPHYIAQIERGKSVAQNIDNLIFRKNGLLYEEFDTLFNSLFDQPDKHISIIKTLATKWNGQIRKEIVENTGLPDGGSLNRILRELEASGFISKTFPFDRKKKGTLYRLTDSFCLFYLKFVSTRQVQRVSFTKLIKSPKWTSWTGYAFENLCLNHLMQIQQSLGIRVISTEVSSFVHRGTKEQRGTQIDLLIDRADRIINLCEIKFYDAPFQITKKYATTLREKRAILREVTQTRKTILMTLIAPYGLRENEHSNSLIDNQIEMADLFAIG